MNPIPRGTRELSEELKIDVVKLLQMSLKDGILTRGAMLSTATLFQVSRATVRKIWRNINCGNLKSKKAGRVGRKPRYTAEEIKAVVQDVHEEQRSTIRNIAESSGLSLAIVSRNLKNGTIERHTTRLKPLLTETNKLQLLTFRGAHANIRREDVMELANVVGAAEAVPTQIPARAADFSPRPFSLLRATAVPALYKNPTFLT
ncbi:Aste57867_12110 [Aphanomyces stellatus]|uniref:Aste57867_12110 protein n=1 Tax=Aphanomyces stellatus TaxID=120398 RepID=A0A485KVH6_9STRA|nr:hypothetical protein As57867_012065 [Aphanomyces stellatus]VFT88964.1 Aste57867_12110 [Aphanomyces stellatus]